MWVYGGGVSYVYDRKNRQYIDPKIEDIRATWWSNAIAFQSSNQSVLDLIKTMSECDHFFLADSSFFF